MSKNIQISWKAYEDITIYIKEDKAKELVKMYREIYPEIAKIWRWLEESIDREPNDEQ